MTCTPGSSVWASATSPTSTSWPYGKSGGKIKGLMEKLGYECDVNTLMMTGKTRQIYYGGAVPMIDVFLDKLDYCHEVDFKDRLEFDDYCISLTDITLQKLQIWEINDKDLKDLEFLFDRRGRRRRRGQEDQPLLHRQAVRRRLGLLVHGHHQPGPGEGPRGRRGRVRRRAESPRQAALRRVAWPASRPSPRPRTGRSGPRRAPRRSGTTRTSATGRLRETRLVYRAYRKVRA